MKEHVVAASKSAGEILKAVVEDGREELDRASVGLAFSGFAAGLNISFSAVAVAVVGGVNRRDRARRIASLSTGLPHRHTGRAQLFTDLLPTTLGNIVGGVVLVTLLNYGQVIGSKKKTSLSKVTDRR